MATKVSQVETEKELLLQAFLDKYEEISNLKETGEMLQKKIDSHVCTVAIPSNLEDPTAQLIQVSTELRLA